MRVFLFLFLLFFGLTNGYCQSSTITTSVYFDTDKYLLRPDAIQTLDELNDSIKDLSIDSIRIAGNTDSRASNAYNVELSKNRSTKVQNYLSTIGIENSLLEIVFFGEEKPKASNADDNGKQENRRVDISVYYHLPALPIIDTIQEDLCQKDTTIRLENGTEFVFNKCEYLEKKDCFTLNEMTNVDDVLANDMSTMDEQGNPLASGGMISFNPIPKPECGNLCFDQKIVVRVKISNEELCRACGWNARLYDVQQDGSWKETGEALKIVEIGDDQYYEFILNNCWIGGKNLDCKVPYYKVKFKAPRGYEFIDLGVASDCPLAAYNFYPETEMREHILKKRKMPCFMGNGDIYARVKNKAGDTLVLKKQPIQDLDKYIWFARCKTKKDEIERNIFGIFPYRKRWLYRKYVIKKDDLTPLK